MVNGGPATSTVSTAKLSKERRLDASSSSAAAASLSPSSPPSSSYSAGASSSDRRVQWPTELEPYVPNKFYQPLHMTEKPEEDCLVSDFVGE